MPEPPQPELFPPETPQVDAIGINARCLLRTCAGHRVVLVAGVPIAHYAVGDAMAEAYAMVQLVTQGWAGQIRTRSPARSSAPSAACAATSAGSRAAGWSRSGALAATRRAGRASTVRATAAST